MDDQEFLRDKAVPMTKKEIRILTLTAARIDENAVICDIGAGTGSLSIEAALLAKNGHVFAIEKNPTALPLINANAAKFGVKNLTIIPATAPYGIADLPDLTAAFVGGSGGNLSLIIEALANRLKVGGRIVVTAITPQTVAACLADMKRRDNFRYEAVVVQVSRLRRVGSLDLPAAQNPITIITGEKV